MEVKKCSKCGVEKGQECFYKKNCTKDGLQTHCKECDKEQNKAWHAKPENKGRVKELHKAWLRNPRNRDRVNEQQRAWWAISENKEHTKEQQRKYRARPEIKEREREHKREYHAKPEVKEHRSEYAKEYSSRPEIKDYINARRQERKRINPWHKLCCNMRTRMTVWVKKNSANKLISAVRDLGCEWPEFKPYFEAKFYPHPVTGEVMSWGNYGQWHVDHIHPLAKVDPENIDEVKAAFHYTNLQPLWAEENLAKGDRITGPRVVL